MNDAEGSTEASSQTDTPSPVSGTATANGASKGVLVEIASTVSSGIAKAGSIIRDDTDGITSATAEAFISASKAVMRAAVEVETSWGDRRSETIIIATRVLATDLAHAGELLRWAASTDADTKPGTLPVGGFEILRDALVNIDSHFKMIALSLHAETVARQSSDALESALPFLQAAVDQETHRLFEELLAVLAETPDDIMAETATRLLELESSELRTGYGVNDPDVREALSSVAKDPSAARKEGLDGATLTDLKRPASAGFVEHLSVLGKQWASLPGAVFASPGLEPMAPEGSTSPCPHECVNGHRRDCSTSSRLSIVPAGHSPASWDAIDASIIALGAATGGSTGIALTVSGTAVLDKIYQALTNSDIYIECTWEQCVRSWCSVEETDGRGASRIVNAPRYVWEAGPMWPDNWLQVHHPQGQSWTPNIPAATLTQAITRTTSICSRRCT